MSDALKLVLLSVVNWLHLVATVIWLGAMVTNMLVICLPPEKVLNHKLWGDLLVHS